MGKLRTSGLTNLEHYLPKFLSRRCLCCTSAGYVVAGHLASCGLLVQETIVLEGLLLMPVQSDRGVVLGCYLLCPIKQIRCQSRIVYVMLRKVSLLGN